MATKRMPAPEPDAPDAALAALTDEERRLLSRCAVAETLADLECRRAELESGDDQPQGVQPGV